MELSREEVKRIALLARLGLSEDEAERMRGQLADILENFEILKGVDTFGIQPASQVTGLKNVFGEDEVGTSLSQDEVLANAPMKDEGFFRIKAVFE